MDQTNNYQPPSGLFERLWKPIVRPPRLQYQQKDLGMTRFLVEKTVIEREDFIVKNPRNHSLKCSLYEPIRMIDKLHPCVIYLHGNSSARIEAIALVEYLLPYGISLCSFDFSACGQSEGEYISLGWYEREDVNCVIKHLKSEKKMIDRIGLWGRSMGAVTSIMCAKETGVDCIVADSAFYSFRKLCQELARKQYKIPSCLFSSVFCCIKSKIHKEAKFNIDDLQTIDYVKQLPQNLPILFLAGKQDVLVNNSHTLVLLEVCKAQKYIIQFDGTHNSRRPKDVQIQISQFFQNNLKGDNSIQSVAQVTIQMPIKIKTKTGDPEEMSKLKNESEQEMIKI